MGRRHQNGSGRFLPRVVAALSVASLACTDFDRLDRCRRESCAATAPEGGVTEDAPAPDVEVFATGQSGVFALALGAGTLFWASAAPRGLVASCPLAGCTTPVVVQSGGSPSALAWSGRLLWSDDADSQLRFTTDTGGVGAAEAGQPTLWVAADKNVYTIQKSGTLLMIAGDPPSDRSTFLSFGTSAERVTTRGAALAWTSRDDSVRLCASGVCATEAESVVARDERAIAIALDDAFLFWTTSDGRVRAVARTATGAAATAVDLARDLPEPASLSPEPSGTFLYFSARGTAAMNYADGVVGKVPKAGGPVTILAKGQARPEGIVVADAYVYWANQYDGTIRRAPK